MAITRRGPITVFVVRVVVMEPWKDNVTVQILRLDIAAMIVRP